MRFLISSAHSSLNAKGPPRLRARRISVRARASLHCGFVGRIVGSYSSGLIALDDAGRPLHVTSDRGVVGPFTIQLEVSEESFGRTIGRQPPAAKVTSDGPQLCVGLWTVDAADASSWSPQVDWPFLRDRPQGWLSIAHRLVGQALPPPVSWWEARMEELLHLRVDEFCAALKSVDGGRIQRACHALAGLGPGLTPAGDDYLAGAVLALRTVRASLRDSITSDIMAGLHGRTTRISWAILQAACLGEASEPWHRLAAALGMADPRVTLRAAEAVGRIGHSTGTWSLRGFVDTLVAVNQAEGAASSPPPPQRGVPSGRSA